MNISYKWLKRFISFSLSPQQLAAVFTSLGLECDTIEEVESIRGGLRGIVIGKVLTCVEHPNSDHLHITTVDLGLPEPVQIVCGAPNVAAGQTVVVATVGTKLYDGDKEFQIKKSKIRGVESFGMICAEDEIGIGNAHDGIMVLEDNAAAPGTPAAEYFNVDSDYMLEVELTPNRVDGASHYGCARDLRAWMAARDFEKNPKAPMPQIFLPEVESFIPDTTEGAVKVTVEDKDGCYRYSGVTVRGVEVKESPDWLKNLLTAAGQRPINNIVDITNFILLGIGQPLHCFDLAHVKDEHIVVRTAAEGTPFVTLDGVEHKLSDKDMMICDSEKPMCIAGVFGGLDSGVTESTKDVFIESAWFNPTRVRRTARRHGLSTDASFRYERGTDPLITVYAAKLAALLIKELAGGTICGEPVDVCEKAGEYFHIDFEPEYCDRLSGCVIPRPLMRHILEALEIRIAAGSTDKLWKLEVPPYRVDVQRPCDVVEEILRVYGYNNVEFTSEMHANLSQRRKTDDSYDLQNLVSDRLSAQGFSEILNNSLTAEKYYIDNEKYPVAECVRIMNPLSSDLALMRRTLLYGGLEVIEHNANRKSPDLCLYEFGNVYHFAPERKITAENPIAPFSEEMHLALWMTGSLTPKSWNRSQAEADVFDLKATVYGLLARLGIPVNAFTETQTSDSDFAAALQLTERSGRHIGTLGMLRGDLCRRFGIEQPVVYAELRWDELMRLALRNTVLYQPLPKSQPVKRDLALLIDQDVTFADVEKTVRKAGGKMLREVSLFDVYEGKNLPDGKKSYAIAITMLDPEKTLQDKQIDAVMKKIVDALAKNVGAELR